MTETVKVKDIMTSGWVAVLGPEDTIEHAAKLFGEYNYDGFPVIDKDRTLVGIVTAYEMISDSAIIHLTELEKIFQKMVENKADENILREHFKKMAAVKVQDIMNGDPLVVTPDIKMEDLAREFAKHHRVNPIPVVNENKKLVGVVSRYDLIRFFDEKYLHRVLLSAGHEGILKRLGNLGMGKESPQE